jgi:ELWxxDGT repeat protein
MWFNLLGGFSRSRRGRIPRQRPTTGTLILEPLECCCVLSALFVVNQATASSSPENLANVNGVDYFTANDGTHGRELWKSDGTATGTTLVKDIKSGTGSSNPDYLTNVNGTLFFTADEAPTARNCGRATAPVPAR